MRKFFVFSFALFSSVCSFAGHVKVFSWSSDGSTSNAVNFLGVSSSNFAVPFYNNVFGFTLRGNDSQANLQAPSLVSSVITNRNSNIDHPISFDDTVSIGSSTVWSSISFSPDLLQLFTFARSVVVSGYSGKGLVRVDSNPGVFNRLYNFDYKVVVGELLCSTNNLYRSLVLSHLSSISSSVSSIDSSVGSIASLVGSIRSSVPVDPFVSDFRSAISNAYEIGAVSTDWVSLDEWLDYYDNLPRGQQELLARGFSAKLSGNYSIPSGLLAASHDIALLNQLPRLGRALNQDINNALTGGSVGSGGIAGDIKRLSTNDWASVVTNQLAQNTSDSKQQLKDNHDSITNQLAHMFDDNPNSVGRAIRSTANNTASTANDVSAIAGKLNSTLHVQIDNPNNIGVVLDGPVTIDTTQFNGVSVPLTGLKDKIDTWYNDWFSFWDISTPAYSWVNFYNMIRDFKYQNHSDIASITNLPFFSSVSNSLASIDKFLQTNSFSSSLHALLLDDYADYITNRFYSSAVDTFKDDYPSVYTNLVKFGLSTEDGEGNFWSLISSTLFYQSALVCGMLEDLATVRQFAEDHIEGGFSGGVTSLIEKMPSSTELADRVNMASNEVLKIEAAANSFYTSYGTMTNTAFSAFSPFRGIFSSVPENIVFFKTGNEQYITIPVSQGGNAWSVIRLCFSFSLVAVNVILFPKFVLMVIVLLSKLSKRFVKFVPPDNI